jgi:arylsulfatase A-like enzyme
MKDQRPNILLITTDQQRGDCLGIEGHPVLQTPNLDWLGSAGTHFRRGYSECPSCVPARRVLMSGQAPAVNGMVGMTGYSDWNPPHTLAGELSRAGYQSEMIGKLHLYPLTKRYGFDHLTLSDASHSWNGKIGENEYVDWLREQGEPLIEPGVAHGVDANGWVGRPTHLPEEKTHTFWCTSKAIEFLNQRDPTAPFFLNLSLIDPHPPLTPPRFYYDRYINEELPMPVVGDWVDWLPEAVRGLSVSSPRVNLNERAMRQARAAYYGMINFVDDQIGRLFNYLRRASLMNNTFILFSSDHGEMLGDHHLYRKCYAYEASARVPFLAKAPAAWEYPAGVSTCVPVGWQDIMPTLLDSAGLDIPDSVTGCSLRALMRNTPEEHPRETLHGEHCGQYEYDMGVHFLTDGHFKYLWYSQTGREQLFNLDNDPHELHDLAEKEGESGVLSLWRQRLVKELAGRPEGFSNGEKLIPGCPHNALMQVHAER